MTPSAIRALRKQVEAGLAGEGWDAYEALPVGQWENAKRAFNGSLDAAKALHETVLPGWWWVKPDGVEIGTIRVVGPDNGDYYPSAVGKHQDPARAWLIAILRALEEEIRTDGQ